MSIENYYGWHVAERRWWCVTEGWQAWAERWQRVVENWLTWAERWQESWETFATKFIATPGTSMANEIQKSKRNRLG